MNIVKVDRSGETVNSRNYQSTIRVERAARTRRAILDAAGARFTSQGYAATTVSQIASDAEVAVDTVYAVVGTKPALFRLLLETAISGTDRAVPAEQREYVQRIRATPRARDKLALYASSVRVISERLAPLQLVLRDAATQDGELARMRDEISARRANNMRLFADDLIATGDVRPDVGAEEIADVVWSTTAAEFYALLVSERGWAPSQFEHWLTDTWQQLFLIARRRHRLSGT
jgi:AcrR family transcriptional regulator